MAELKLSQKRTCKGCWAWHATACGEYCDLGFECEGMGPLEECIKPKTKKLYTVALEWAKQVGEKRKAAWDSFEKSLNRGHHADHIPLPLEG